MNFKVYIGAYNVVNLLTSGKVTIDWNAADSETIKKNLLPQIEGMDVSKGTKLIAPGTSMSRIAYNMRVTSRAHINAMDPLKCIKTVSNKSGTQRMAIVKDLDSDYL